MQKSCAFLDSLTQRTESADRSEEAASLRDELFLYLSCTLQEQEARVEEVRLYVHVRYIHAGLIPPNGV